MEQATLAGGCFWCTEAVFLQIEGVAAVESGYTGGTTENPSYEEVCRGDTGHAEAVRIDFDPEKISYDDLLDIFFATHDPTQLNRQGNDVGTQYRSAIFVSSAEKRAAAEAIKARYEGRLRSQGYAAITTTIKPEAPFYYAEAEH
ncbi:MAG: peptide-methionine (S)-S-oxide reductase MsrA, partial [Sphingomonadaceae bacterium]